MQTIKENLARHAEKCYNISMPLESQAQAAFLKHRKPKLFEEFRSKTPKGTKLPKRVKPSNDTDSRRAAVKRAADGKTHKV